MGTIQKMFLLHFRKYVTEGSREERHAEAVDLHKVYGHWTMNAHKKIEQWEDLTSSLVVLFKINALAGFSYLQHVVRILQSQET